MHAITTMKTADSDGYCSLRAAEKTNLDNASGDVPDNATLLKLLGDDGLHAYGSDASRHSETEHLAWSCLRLVLIYCSRRAAASRTNSICTHATR